MVKKFLAAFWAVVLCIVFTGCAADAGKENTTVESTETQAAYESPEVVQDNTAIDEEKEFESTETVPIEEPDEVNQAFVVYFSATGTTKSVAEIIASVTGADLYEITPTQSYSSDDLDYNDSNSRTTKEQNDKSVRPEIDGSIDNWDQYSIVFLGHPIWWGEEPRIMDTFTESYEVCADTIGSVLMENTAKDTSVVDAGCVNRARDFADHLGRMPENLLCTSTILTISGNRDRTGIEDDYAYLVPVKVNKKIILNQWNFFRTIFLQDGYLRDENLMDYNEGMQEIIDKLVILREHGNMRTAIEAGEQIIQDLQGMTGQDEDFPDLDIAILKRIINKYR